MFKYVNTPRLPKYCLCFSDNDIVHISDHLFQHLLQGQQMQLVIQSVVDLLNQYLIWIKDSAPLSTSN